MEKVYNLSVIGSVIIEQPMANMKVITKHFVFTSIDKPFNFTLIRRDLMDFYNQEKRDLNVGDTLKESIFMCINTKCIDRKIQIKKFNLNPKNIRTEK